MATRRLTREERREQTREQLLDAAGTVFAQRGYAGASVDEIAGEAGFTTGALYSNFDGKEDLFLALIERHAARQMEELAEAVSSGPTVEDRVHTGARNWMSFLQREPELFPLLMEFWAFAVRNPRLRPRFARQQARARQLVTGLIEAGARELDLELTLPPEQLASAIDALADGLALQRLADPHSVPAELFGDVLEALFAGATRPRSARTRR
jgi:AcrR family transcriptional regulator